MLELHRRRRLGLLEAHLDARHLGDDRFVPLRDQLLKELERLGLVFVERVALRHAAPADHLPQMVERHQMVAPEVIERLQDHLLLDVAHGFGRIALNALDVGLLGRLVEAGGHFLLGDALFLRPGVDRQVEVELAEDFLLQAGDVPRFRIGVVRDVLGDQVVDDARAHVLDVLLERIRPPSSCAGPRR